MKPLGLEYVRPRGGVYIWCRLPEGVDSMELEVEARRMGVSIVPGYVFYPGKSGGRNYIRLNFSYESRERIRQGLDIHTVTASQVFNVEPEHVTPVQRRHAKAVNFGIVYGISEFSLAEDIGVSRYEAKSYIDSYLNNYHGVRAYMKNVVENARETGYTLTMYGRRRYVPELKSSNFNIRSGAERVTLNTPIQGSAADLIKLAMIRVDKALSETYPEAQLILQVHDELIVEFPAELAAQVAELVSKEMEQVAQLSVPLVAEANWGSSWYEAK